MTITIGIHQQQDKVDKLYENLGLRAAPLTAVGPFSSKEEALAWQQSMQQKSNDCQIIEMGAPDEPDSPWYGFFFEQLP